MVILISLLQSTEDGNGTDFIRLIHHYRLKTTLKCLVLFEVFLILIECCGTDTAKFATSQCRFEDISGIHCSLATSSSHEGVYLVDKEDDTSVALGDLVDYGFQSFLKLALILGTCHKGTHVKREELLVL